MGILSYAEFKNSLNEKYELNENKSLSAINQVLTGSGTSGVDALGSQYQQFEDEVKSFFTSQNELEKGESLDISKLNDILSDYDLPEVDASMIKRVKEYDSGYLKDFKIKGDYLVKENSIETIIDLLEKVELLEKDYKEKMDGNNAYQKFFKKKLKKYGVDSPAQLSVENKKKFYNEIDKQWKADNEE